jgi:hypothetical protein
MRSGVTWYGILGVMPGASPEEIQQRYEAKAAVLRPEHVAGAPSHIVAAVVRAQALLDQALRVLTDRDARLHYDEAVGLRRSGGGLMRGSGHLDTDAGWPPEIEVAGFEDATTALEVLAEMTDMFTPKPPRRPGRIVVPDVRWLFYSVCREALRGHELELNVIRLTERPMPVDGVVVDQSPRPLAKARRAGGLTIQVWHPSAHLAGR